MNTSAKSLGLLCSAMLGLVTGPLHAQFQQLNAGAESTNLNAKLAWANGATFAASSGYSHLLVYTVVTNFVMTNIFYSTTNLQFWALSKTNASGLAIGSHAVCEVVSVAGPVGGVLSLWEQGWRVPTYIYPVGVTPVVGSNRFDVSDIATGAGLVDGDPAGRIPLRRFTVNLPGEYLATFKLLDTSTNTPAGGPIHTPSDPITIKFTTGFDLAVTRYVVASNGVETLTFKQSALTNLFVDSRTEVASGDWTPVAGPFLTAPALNNTTTLNFTNPPVPKKFYRLRGVAP